MSEHTNRPSRRWLAPVLLVLAAVIAAALISSRPSAKTASATESAIRVDTFTVAIGKHSPSIPVYVKVTTPQHSRLRTSITADVIDIHALQGSKVKKGDVLVQLDERDAKLILQQRQADVVEAQSQIDAQLLKHKNELFVIRNDKGKRAEHNREQIIKGHEIQLSGLQARLKRARAALALAELDVQHTRIVAPFDGQVTATHVSRGDRVRPGDMLIELFDLESLELSGTIAQRYVSTILDHVNSNEPLTASTVWQGQLLSATLDRLAGDVDEQSGGIPAFFQIQGSSEHLALGRSLKLQLRLPAIKHTFIAPNTAIFGTNRVYKIIDGRLKAVNVSRLGDFHSTESMPASVLLSEDIQDSDILLKTQLPNAIENLLVDPTS